MRLEPVWCVCAACRCRAACVWQAHCTVPSEAEESGLDCKRACCVPSVKLKPALVLLLSGLLESGTWQTWSLASSHACWMTWTATH